MDFTMNLMMLMKLKVSVLKLCIEVYEDSVVDCCEVILRNKLLGFGGYCLMILLIHRLTRCGGMLWVFVSRWNVFECLKCLWSVDKVSFFSHHSEAKINNLRSSERSFYEMNMWGVMKRSVCLWNNQLFMRESLRTMKACLDKAWNVSIAWTLKVYSKWQKMLCNDEFLI